MNLRHLLLLCLSGASVPAAEYRLSGPFTHEQATVYLVHLTAAPNIAGRKYLPLKEALAQRNVIVHETGNVNTLAIENLSADTDVFIQSGDIVKGGQQDRVFATDLILPPKSGRTPIESFCVEQGRWTRRGGEDSRTFSASNFAIVSRQAKLAIKGSKNQGEVWRSVADTQSKLVSTIGGSAAVGSTSPTSLQLSLENKAVNDNAAQFATALRKALHDSPGAAGYVFALNGEIQSADVYSSPSLFRELWPKLSQALAIEALTEKRNTPSPKAVTQEAALAFLTPAGTTVNGSPNSRTRVAKKDSARSLYVESADGAYQAWVHRSFTAK
jgi:hypothetical protein